MVADLYAQPAAVSSPCPGYTNTSSTDKKNDIDRFDTHVVLLTSALTTAQKMTCLVTEGITARLHNLLQADGPLYKVEFQDWDSLNWVPSRQDTYTYNTEGFVESRTRSLWDAGTQSYSTINAKSSYTYDTSGLMLTSTWQSWSDSLNAFANDSQSIFAWDENGELVSTHNYGWNGTDWILGATLTRTIENGVAIEELRKRRNQDTGAIIEDTRVLF